MNILFCALILLGSYVQGYNNIALIIMILCFIPTFLLYFILKKINTKKKSKVLSILISIALLIVLIIYEFIGFVFFVFTQDLVSLEPTKFRYTGYLSKMSKNPYRIKHFPKVIPHGAKDYYFLIERDLRGYNIHYLKFKTDKKYIEDTLDKNKNDIYKKIKFKDISDYYRFINNYFDVKDIDNAFVYILKNENNDKNYTSGIVTSQIGEIVFFYANFNLKQYLTK